MALLTWPICTTSCAPLRRGSDLRIALYHRNHVAADGLRNLHEHQSDWTAAITVTVSPISTPVSCNPRSTQASGSVMAASSKLTCEGTASMLVSTIRSGMRMYSA